MSTHKHFDKICCVVLALTLILSVLFMNAEHFGVQKAATVMGYEKTLFDTSKVHTIDIIMDDWDAFTANCKSEEYYDCTVVIDNETYKNVAIRGKGNTSLSQVSNGRYSYKIEFDHYDNTNTYYGLDKLCLNNIIQDNTYMKDYLTYQMMDEMGVASPLCSYAYITVNGEDWGLYLAVEGVEESFLQRNYGKGYGELYKPDSMRMGGGRGNGESFNIDDFLADFESGNTENDDSGDFPQRQGGTPGDFGGQMPESMFPPTEDGDNPFAGGDNGGFPGGMPEGMTPPAGNGGFQFPMTPPGNDGDSDGAHQNNIPDGTPEGFGGMGSSDVKLQYIDDSADSYSNIFGNAKTDLTVADQTRLITALKKLSNGEDLENTVEIDGVIRYFVVHNFVLNFDSYTGSMVHNYYLYENDGQMQMIPWDYNLAFGGFQSMGSATSLVNFPIDSPVSGGNVGDRPMLAWIFANEEYTELYHKYFEELIATYFDSGYFEEMVDDVISMLSPYVEKDPTKFCTYEEFETGISTLKAFCLLRAESVSGQLDGTIGSTSDTQKSDTLIDAGDIQIDAMGSMGNMGGRMTLPGGDMRKPQGDSETPDSSGTEDRDTGNHWMQQMPGGQMPGDTLPDFENSGQSSFAGQMQRPDFNARPDASGQTRPQTQNGTSSTSWIMLGVSVLVLALGLVFAFAYKRRK